MVLLAICKAYRFIYDFINEIVRDTYFNRYEKISKTSFNEFFNEKKYEHPELEKVTEKSVGKMRQVLFRILEQTELIEDTNSGLIRRPYLNNSVYNRKNEMSCRGKTKRSRLSRLKKC